MLPKELAATTPRDISVSQHLFSKNTKLINGLFIGGAVAGVLTYLIFLWKFDDSDSMFGIIAAVVVASLVEMVGVALLVQKKRLENLFINGTATIGKVLKVTAAADTNQSAYIFIDVQFTDMSGAALSGKVSTIGKTDEIHLKENSEVPVLYQQGSSFFGIYDTTLGMIGGAIGK